MAKIPLEKFESEMRSATEFETGLLSNSFPFESKILMVFAFGGSVNCKVFEMITPFISELVWLARLTT